MPVGERNSRIWKTWLKPPGKFQDMPSQIYKGKISCFTGQFKQKSFINEIFWFKNEINRKVLLKKVVIYSVSVCCFNCEIFGAVSKEKRSFFSNGLRWHIFCLINAVVKTLCFNQRLCWVRLSHVKWRSSRYEQSSLSHWCSAVYSWEVLERFYADSFGR